MAFHLIDPECGQPALVYLGDTLLRSGDPIIASDFRHLDGSPYVVGDLMICDSCHQVIISYLFQLEHFRQIEEDRG